MNLYDEYDLESEAVLGIDRPTYLATNLDNPSTDDICNHYDTFESDLGNRVCKECGCEVDSLDFEAEWRYYGSSDNKNSSDPSRCHSHTEHTKNNIDAVFLAAKINIPMAIRKKTEQKYKIVVGDHTVRGKGRKAIVAAALLHTYLEEGDNRTSDEIRGMFGLTKQQMSDGIARYYSSFPEDRIRCCKPKDLITRVMFSVGIPEKHYQNIYNLTELLENADEMLKRSSPNSVASSIVYLYVCLNKKLRDSLKLTKSDFSKKVGLSDITISKLTKKAAALLNLQLTI